MLKRKQENYLQLPIPNSPALLVVVQVFNFFSFVPLAREPDFEFLASSDFTLKNIEIEATEVNTMTRKVNCKTCYSIYQSISVTK